MKTKNKIGIYTEPCGTPDSTDTCEDISFLSVICLTESPLSIGEPAHEHQSNEAYGATFRD